MIREVSAPNIESRMIISLLKRQRKAMSFEEIQEALIAMTLFPTKEMVDKWLSELCDSGYITWEISGDYIFYKA